MRPVVAVTAYRDPARFGVWDRPADLLATSYADALLAAGAQPLLVPSVEPDVDALLDRVDGLVLAGGPDLGGTHPQRDEAELALARAALDRSLPLLAICRGMQLLDVLLGGDLVEDLERAGLRTHSEGPGRMLGHPVRVDPGSRLAAATGSGVQVRCHHHQALRRLGTGVQPVAWAEDGTVEAVELDGHPEVTAVQWHPEDSPEDPVVPAFVHLVRDRSTSPV